ncbi:hypothetical protein HN924_00335 [Candidatus Woesearchaeota archaeon]|jgi:hypothetical protein|nr:hypothetical protein [Candidatus Woesearchaeota archaeon]MBT7062399.1 hypothetical protein [Candidatus Woesearchaeota archaeon]MBT7402197.1 hypothetical protein [Candidatus Woesearchaeota archaeon]
MNTLNLKKLVKEIVGRADELKRKHIENKDALVNYACIFSQSKDEYDELLEAAKKMGTVVKETPTGLLFQIKPLKTVAGDLKLLKIRIYDPTRPEQGDADFTISNFAAFEKKYLPKSGFKLIKRPDFVMIELMDHKFDVRAYFSNPTLEVQLNIK